MIISSQDGLDLKIWAGLRGMTLPRSCSPCTDGSTPKRFGPPDAPPTFGGSLVLHKATQTGRAHRKKTSQQLVLAGEMNFGEWEGVR